MRGSLKSILTTDGGIKFKECSISKEKPMNPKATLLVLTVLIILVAVSSLMFGLQVLAVVFAVMILFVLAMFFGDRANQKTRAAEDAAKAKDKTTTSG